MAAMEKLWYFTQGNVTAHLKKKTDSENTGTGVTWDRWNSDRMGRILPWDKCTVFFNIGPSRANLKVSVDKIGTDWQKAFLIHKKQHMAV